MLAGIKDYTIEKGAVFDEQFIWKNADGSIKNLAGYTAEAEARKQKSDNAAILAFTVTLGGANGTVRLQATSSQTRALDFSKAFWDVKVSPSGGDVNTTTDVIRPMEGRLTFSEEATKDAV